jgi:hypothetical protein
MESGLALILTQIGAATGFIAFLMKVWEFYYDRRPKLRISCSLTSDPDRGSTITILNSSKVGTSIHYYQLEALPKSRLNRWWPRFPKGWEHIEFSLEEQTVNIPVPPHGHADIHFEGQDHFNWGASRTDDLYLRIWTAFRDRPYTFFVVGAGGDR